MSLKNRVLRLLVFSLLLTTSGALQSQTLTNIKYELNNVVKKKIKNGVVIEEKNEPMEFLGTPFQYYITELNTKSPILRKYIDSVLVEQKQLVILNKTQQGNFYLADVSAVGNVVLITIMPKQKTVAVSYQYWLSYEDVVILWQGHGIYK